MKKNVSLLQLENNSQIGMYFIAADEFALCGKQLTNEQKEQIEKVLNVPVIILTCYNSDIIGVFMQVDRYNKAIFIPNDLYEEEVKQLENLCKTHNYTLIQLSSTNNTLGNLIAATPSSLIVSKDLKKNLQELKRKSQKEVLILENEDFHQAGALICSNNKSTLASSQLDDASLEKIEDYVDNITTANNGSAYISSAIVANSNGILLGDQTTSVEIQIILETLKYL